MSVFNRENSISLLCLDEGIGMAELIDLPDKYLKKVVPKIGPWNKLCKAKRTLQETYSKVHTDVKPDKMMEFLHDLGLQQYVSVFKGKRKTKSKTFNNCWNSNYTNFYEFKIR